MRKELNKELSYLTALAQLQAKQKSDLQKVETWLNRPIKTIQDTRAADFAKQFDQFLTVLRWIAGLSAIFVASIWLFWKW
jgi:hypothetical protein